MKITEQYPRQEIHITSDGRTTHAVYKLDGKVFKRSKAACSNSDSYDFMTGAGLAYSRLTGIQQEPTQDKLLKITCGTGDVLVGYCDGGAYQNVLYVSKIGNAFPIGKILTRADEKTKKGERPLLEVRFTKPESVDTWITQLQKISEQMRAQDKPSQPEPQYKEVKRKAVKGEKIKVVDAKLTGGKYKTGDIFTVNEIFSPSVGVTEHSCPIWDTEYVVLEPLSPAPKPWKPAVGDLVYITEDGNGFKKGDIATASSGHGCSTPTAINPAGSEVHLPQILPVREEDRAAKVGEWIKITKSESGCYEVGTIHKCSQVGDDYIDVEDCKFRIWATKYVVLTPYTPD